jgi:hypothetical protein
MKKQTTLGVLIFCIILSSLTSTFSCAFLMKRQTVKSLKDYQLEVKRDSVAIYDNNRLVSKTTLNCIGEVIIKDNE